jgi:hypothetical protein
MNQPTLPRHDTHRTKVLDEVSLTSWCLAPFPQVDKMLDTARVVKALRQSLMTQAWSTMRADFSLIAGDLQLHLTENDHEEVCRRMLGLM